MFLNFFFTIFLNNEESTEPDIESINKVINASNIQKKSDTGDNITPPTSISFKLGDKEVAIGADTVSLSEKTSERTLENLNASVTGPEVQARIEDTKKEFLKEAINRDMSPEDAKRYFENAENARPKYRGSQVNNKFVIKDEANKFYAKRDENYTVASRITTYDGADSSFSDIQLGLGSIVDNSVDMKGTKMRLQNVQATSVSGTFYSTSSSYGGFFTIATRIQKPGNWSKNSLADSIRSASTSEQARLNAVASFKEAFFDSLDEVLEGKGPRFKSKTITIDAELVQPPKIKFTPDAEETCNKIKLLLDPFIEIAIKDYSMPIISKKDLEYLKSKYPSLNEILSRIGLFSNTFETILASEPAEFISYAIAKDMYALITIMSDKEIPNFESLNMNDQSCMRIIGDISKFLIKESLSVLDEKLADIRKFTEPEVTTTTDMYNNKFYMAMHLLKSASDYVVSYRAKRSDLKEPDNIFITLFKHVADVAAQCEAYAGPTISLEEYNKIAIAEVLLRYYGAEANYDNLFEGESFEKLQESEFYNDKDFTVACRRFEDLLFTAGLSTSSEGIEYYSYSFVKLYESLMDSIKFGTISNYDISIAYLPFCVNLCSSTDIFASQDIISKLALNINNAIYTLINANTQDSNIKDIMMSILDASSSYASFPLIPDKKLNFGGVDTQSVLNINEKVYDELLKTAKISAISDEDKNKILQILKLNNIDAIFKAIKDFSTDQESGADIIRFYNLIITNILKYNPDFIFTEEFFQLIECIRYSVYCDSLYCELDSNRVLREEGIEDINDMPEEVKEKLEDLLVETQKQIFNRMKFINLIPKDASFVPDKAVEYNLLIVNPKNISDKFAAVNNNAISEFNKLFESLSKLKDYNEDLKWTFFSYLSKCMGGFRQLTQPLTQIIDNIGPSQKYWTDILDMLGRLGGDVVALANLGTSVIIPITKAPVSARDLDDAERAELFNSLPQSKKEELKKLQEFAKIQQQKAAADKIRADNLNDIKNKYGVLPIGNIDLENQKSMSIVLDSAARLFGAGSAFATDVFSLFQGSYTIGDIQKVANSTINDPQGLFNDIQQELLGFFASIRFIFDNCNPNDSNNFVNILSVPVNIFANTASWIIGTESTCCPRFSSLVFVVGIIKEFKYLLESLNKTFTSKESVITKITQTFGSIFKIISSSFILYRRPVLGFVTIGLDIYNEFKPKPEVKKQTAKKQIKLATKSL